MDSKDKNFRYKAEITLMKATSRGIIHEFRKNKADTKESFATVDSKLDVLEQDIKETQAETRNNRKLVIASMVLGVLAEIISSYWSIKNG